MVKEQKWQLCTAVIFRRHARQAPPPRTSTHSTDQGGQYKPSVALIGRVQGPPWWPGVFALLCRSKSVDRVFVLLIF